MKKTYALLVILLVLCSCQDQDYLHAKYLNEGEITYIGKSEQVRANPGRYRIEAIWTLSKDPKALYTLIEIGEDSITVINADYATTESIRVKDEEGNTVQKEFAVGKYLIEGLAEKDYTLKFSQTDGEGATSVKSEAFAATYGSRYESRLINQLISSMQYIDKDVADGIDSVKIVFAEQTGSVGIKLKYKPISAEDSLSITLPAKNNGAVLVGTNPGEKFTYFTRYLPPNGIDTVSATALTEQVPYHKSSQNN